MARLIATAILLGACAAHAQTLPLPPGTGFEWEQVGDRDDMGARDLWFDAGGTLWVPSQPPIWLDLRGGWPGVWQQANPPNPQPFGNAMLTLGVHPLGGPPRADTLLVTAGDTRRSTDGGNTWSGLLADNTNYALYEIPAGLPHAGRLLAGNFISLSDDRGATWRDSLYTLDDLPFAAHAFLALPRPDALPGAASGRDTAAPPGWPAGRVVAVGYGAVAALSDDGGDSWRASSNGTQFGINADDVALVRRPDTHPLGPGPRLLWIGAGETTATSLYVSDDAGETWARIVLLSEPSDGPGWPGAAAVVALPEPGETDAGADGRALAVLGRGHLFETTDGGNTWHVVGRMPGIVPASEPEPTTRATDAELGPDGRLYVAVTRNAVWRTAEPFVVAGEVAPPAAPSGLSISVQPNPVSGTAQVDVSAGVAADARIEVLDALGRVVSVVHAGPLGAGTHRFALGVAGWAAGMYAVRAEGSGGSIVARFTVAR
jgi:hypothetical protein